MVRSGFGRRCVGAVALVFLFLGIGKAELAAPGRKTVLGCSGQRFTMNGTAVFLLGFSYYGGLGASEEFVQKDLDDFQRLGFNWLRIWATWSDSSGSISAVDREGRGREPFLSKLEWVVAECDRRGMIVDVTLARGDKEWQLLDLAAHRRAVEVLMRRLGAHRNWYLDLANEHDVRDARYVSIEELKILKGTARAIDSERLITASTGGHDLSDDDVEQHVKVLGVSFLAPHRPRDAASPGQTQEKTRLYLHYMTSIGTLVPVLYQEPFRRGYGEWQPKASDFLEDLKGAKAGGSAGWCFHNGSSRVAGRGRPGKSFDLRAQRLFGQLDDEERAFVEEVARVLGSGSSR